MRPCGAQRGLLLEREQGLLARAETAQVAGRWVDVKREVCRRLWVVLGHIVSQGRGGGAEGRSFDIPR